MTSGFTVPSYQAGPRELYGATTSSPRVTVFMLIAAPIVIADGALPGDAMPAYPDTPVFGFWPKLPADTTTMSPALVAASTACTSGSSLAGAKIGWPSDRLIMCTFKCDRFATTYSIALMTSVVLP